MGPVMLSDMKTIQSYNYVNLEKKVWTPKQGGASALLYSDSNARSLSVFRA